MFCSVEGETTAWADVATFKSTKAFRGFELKSTELPVASQQNQKKELISLIDFTITINNEGVAENLFRFHKGWM